MEGYFWNFATFVKWSLFDSITELIWNVNISSLQEDEYLKI